MTTGLSLFDPLPLHSYDLVVVHPPWPYETWSPRGPALSSPCPPGTPDRASSAGPLHRLSGSTLALLVHFIGSTLAKSRSPWSRPTP